MLPVVVVTLPAPATPNSILGDLSTFFLLSIALCINNLASPFMVSTASRSLTITIAGADYTANLESLSIGFESYASATGIVKKKGEISLVNVPGGGIIDPRLTKRLRAGKLIQVLLDGSPHPLAGEVRILDVSPPDPISDSLPAVEGNLRINLSIGCELAYLSYETKDGPLSGNLFPQYKSAQDAVEFLIKLSYGESYTNPASVDLAALDDNWQVLLDGAKIGGNYIDAAGEIVYSSSLTAPSFLYCDSSNTIRVKALDVAPLAYTSFTLGVDELEYLPQIDVDKMPSVIVGSGVGSLYTQGEALSSSGDVQLLTTNNKTKRINGKNGYTITRADSGFALGRVDIRIYSSEIGDYFYGSKMLDSLGVDINAGTYSPIDPSRKFQWIAQTGTGYTSGIGYMSQLESWGIRDGQYRLLEETYTASTDNGNSFFYQKNALNIDNNFEYVTASASVTQLASAPYRVQSTPFYSDNNVLVHWNLRLDNTSQGDKILSAKYMKILPGPEISDIDAFQGSYEIRYPENYYVIWNADPVTYELRRTDIVSGYGTQKLGYPEYKRTLTKGNPTWRSSNASPVGTAVAPRLLSSEGRSIEVDIQIARVRDSSHAGVLIESEFYIYGGRQYQYSIELPTGIMEPFDSPLDGFVAVEPTQKAYYLADAITWVHDASNDAVGFAGIYLGNSALLDTVPNPPYQPLAEIESLKEDVLGTVNIDVVYGAIA